MTIRVNGGIINDQMLSGGLRFFKIAGPFAWTLSDGTVNLPVSVVGGTANITTYFQVGNNRPVPGSAADAALRVIQQQADIVLIGLSPAAGASTAELHIAVSASALGWGSDLPDYTAAPGAEVQLPTTPTNAAVEMQAAIRAIPNLTVYITVGSANQALAPVTTTANFSTATVTEVSFSLGSLTYYTLA